MQLTIVLGKGQVAHSGLPKADHGHMWWRHVLPILGLQIAIAWMTPGSHHMHAPCHMALSGQLLRITSRRCTAWHLRPPHG